MQSRIPPIRLRGGSYIQNGRMVQGSVGLAYGRISDGDHLAVDLPGYLILPGLVDMRSIGLEDLLLSGLSPDAALRELDWQAATAGVTTAWLSQGWSWEGGVRGTTVAEQVLAAMRSLRGRTLTDVRIQIACDMHNIDGAARLITLVARDGIDSAVFVQAAPRAVERRERGTAALERDIALSQSSRASYLVRLERALERASEVPRHVCRLAAAFDRMGVRYGSFGDTDGEVRERHSMIGAKIAFAPASRKAAAAAAAVGDPIVLSTDEPNRKSVSTYFGTPLPVVSSVANDWCQSLSSGRHFDGLANTIWEIVDSGVADLPTAWQLGSEAPARIMKLTDRGRIGSGMRADLVILNPDTREIEATICDGRPVHLSGDAGEAIQSAIETVPFAAE